MGASVHASRHRNSTYIRIDGLKLFIWYHRTKITSLDEPSLQTIPLETATLDPLYVTNFILHFISVFDIYHLLFVAHFVQTAYLLFFNHTMFGRTCKMWILIWNVIHHISLWCHRKIILFEKIQQDYKTILFYEKSFPMYTQVENVAIN